MLLSNTENELPVANNITNFTDFMLSEGSQTQKVTYCMIPFIRNVYGRKICRDRQWIGGFQGLGDEENGN